MTRQHDREARSFFTCGALLCTARSTTLSHELPECPWSRNYRPGGAGRDFESSVHSFGSEPPRDHKRRTILVKRRPQRRISWTLPGGLLYSCFRLADVRERALHPTRPVPCLRAFHSNTVPDLFHQERQVTDQTAHTLSLAAGFGLLTILATHQTFLQEIHDAA